jgi:hypothetical protein
MPLRLGASEGKVKILTVSPLLVPLVTQLILAWDSITEYLTIHLGYPVAR